MDHMPRTPSQHNFDFSNVRAFGSAKYTSREPYVPIIECWAKLGFNVPPSLLGITSLFNAYYCIHA